MLNPMACVGTSATLGGDGRRGEGETWGRSDVGAFRESGQTP